MKPSALKELLSSLSAEERAQLDRRMQSGAAPATPTIGRRQQTGPAPLSSAQRGLWFLYQYDRSSCAYNELLPLRLLGELEVERLQAALNQVVERHHTLRTTFAAGADGEPVQIVGAATPLPLQVRELDEAAVTRQLQTELALPFDLENGPLLRASLYRMGPKDHVLALCLHHIVTDAWSVGVLIQELAAHYQGKSLPELPVQYTDYAAWQRQPRDCRAQRLQGAPELLQLPLDRPRPAVQRPVGASLPFEIPAPVVGSLRQLARQAQVTPYVVLLSTFGCLLQRYSRSHDLLIGTPSANRHHQELESLIGFFINTLVVRLQLQGNPTFRELLERTKQATLDVFDSQEIAFEELVEALKPRRDPGYHPVFQVMFAMETIGQPELQLPGLRLARFPVPLSSSKFDLTLSLDEGETSMQGYFNYNTDLFDHATIERLAGHFVALLQSALEHPDQPVGQLNLLGSEERDQLIRRWNQTEVSYPPELVFQCFEKAARQWPDQVAVVFQERQLSYAELERCSDRLAAALRARGIGPDQGVGLRMHRSLELIVGVLGTLKAGGYYLPLDPDYPQERLDFLIENAGLQVVLQADDVWAPAADFSQAAVHPDHLAYVLYTSGSTGRPKGVMVSHGSLINRLRWYDCIHQLVPGQRVALKAPLSFDFSVHELFWPLIHGATLVVLDPEGHKDADYLVEQIEKHQLVTMHFAPAMLAAFLEVAAQKLDKLRSLQVITAGADALSPALRDQCLSLLPIPFYNLYGPTEATIDAAYYDCRQPESEHYLAVSLGRPVANAQIYILDEWLQPAPVGVPGELCIGGVPLARGYLNNPALTAERFIPDPFSSQPEARLYRSGDLARWRASGQLEFLGRLDHQVKVRGFRIELAEIESWLLLHPLVKEAVVTVTSQRLLAYVVGGASAAELRTYLARQLPEYMLPSDYIFLEQLPRTASAKVDRKALPEPSLELEPYCPPSSQDEKNLSRIWCELLGLEQVGSHDNFFALGGDSILSIQLVARARQQGLRLTVKMVFEYQTIAELAAAPRPQAPLETAQDECGPLPLTPIQRAFLARNEGPPDHFYQSIWLQLPAGTRPDWLEECLNHLVQAHPALRLRWQPEAQSIEKGPLESVLTTGLPQLQSGPLLRGRLQDDRLLLVAHHFAVDGVSWSILLADLELAYAQREAGQPIQLPPASTSWRHWVERLQNFPVAPELEYWRAELAKPASCLPRESQGPNLVGDCGEIAVQLSEAETEQLLRELPAVYRTHINEVLLTALARALGEWTGQQGWFVDLEGHGREELFAEVDLSRTVGWFTTMFPVHLDGRGDLRQLKEQLRRMPHHGLGYGLLAYVRQALAPLAAEISFNYLGQWQQGQRFRLLPEEGEAERPPQATRAHLLDIVGQIWQGRLELRVRHNHKIHSAESVGRLAQLLVQALRQLLQESRQPGAGGFTPGDFPLVELCQAQIDRLPPGVEDVYGLTPMQQGMLFHSLYAPDSGDYQEVLSLELLGPLDLAAFREAWQSLLDRHTSLRSFFVWEAERQPLQVVLAQLQLPWHELDWRGLEDQEQRLEQLIAGLRRPGLHPARPPLMAVYVVRRDAQRWQVLWQHHHLLLDGWCLPLLLSEMLSLYGDPQALLPKARPYRVYLEWLKTQDHTAARAFWQHQLQGFEPQPMSLAAPDQPRPGQALASLTLSAEQSAALAELARSQRVTLSTVLVGAWSLLVALYSGQSDVVIGQTVSGRPPELEGVDRMVGLFINTLPVRVETAGKQPLGDWLRRLQAEQSERQGYAYSSLSEVGMNLFDSLLVLENYPVEEELLARADFQVVGVESYEQTNYGLTLVIQPGPCLLLKLAYDSERYAAWATEQLLSQLRDLLVQMGEQPEAALEQFPARPALTPLDPPVIGETILDRFRAQVLARPEQPAVENLSYLELDQRSNWLAGQLVGAARVGVCLERSAATLIAFVAVLKAGAAYVPLDPAYPEDRLRYMVEDCRLELLISEAPRPFFAGRTLAVGAHKADHFEPLGRPDSAAYVIYTSGTTGRPKGVVLGHRGLINLALSQVEILGIGPDSRIGQRVSTSFDVSIADMAMALVSGARLCLDPSEPVTHLQVPPSLLAGMDPQVPLPCLILGGEVCPPAVLQRWSPGRRIFNAYGPTEGTVCCSLYEYRGQGMKLGVPLPNTQFLVLDEQQRPVPDGVRGELYLGGVGLAEGYLGQPELTAERFPRLAGGRFYRSGDRVRRNRGGELEFLGRLDQQIKVRGYRVEPAEIEAVLRQLGTEAVVRRRPQQEQLMAYVVSPLSQEELRLALSQRLPEYMVPSHFVHLAELPRLANGKIDLAALPLEGFQGGGRPPRNPVEEMLVVLFQEVLGLERVGIEDDFFALGGHSLLATQTALRVGALWGREVPVRMIFEAPTVALLAERLPQAGLGERERIPRLTDQTGEFPLSFAQERMWFLDQWDEGAGVYTIMQALEVEGPLDAGALERGLRQLVERHASLRTVFRLVDGIPRQRVLEQTPEFWAATAVETREAALQQLTHEASRSFDLEAGPPLRAGLLTLSPDRHFFYVHMHHIVSDGWSMGIFFEELAALYRGQPLAPPALSYLDFAVWQRQWLQGEVLARQLAWWRGHLQGAPPLLELPSDRPRPRLQSYRGASLDFQLPLPEVSGLTPFMVLQASLALLFSRYSGQSDVVIGTPIANRNQLGVESIMGYFLNVLPLRTDLSGDPTFDQLLQRVRQVTLAAYEHQDMPFEYLVDQLQPERRLDHTPIFQVLMFFQNLQTLSADFPGLQLRVIEQPKQTAKLDMSLTLSVEAGQIRGSWEYNTDLFDASTIERMVAHWGNLLGQGLAHPQRRISELDMLCPAERYQLLVEWNRSQRSYPGTTFLDGLVAQVARTPERVACVYGDRRLTYAQIDQQSDLLAGYLAERGVAREVMVTVCARRSPEMLVAFLAILKAGGVYVPVDPAYPEDRIQFMLSDCQSRLLLGQSELDSLPSLTGSTVPLGPGPENLAYMIYTSGSTGKPKAAMVNHRGMLNHLYAKIYDLGLVESDCIVQNASQCFDISIWQFLAALLVGASVHIVPDEIAHHPVRLFAYAQAENITILEVVPSVLSLFLGEDSRPDLSSLRWLIPTGEALQPESCRGWFAAYPGVPMINAYGPSECSDDVTHYVIRNAPGEEVVNMPVGRPVINTQMYVLDAALQPVPVGISGELYVGGRGVGRGYLGRTDLTAQIFLPDPFSGVPGARLYKTGDLARYHKDGNIEFLGRVDHQIKIRGFRIELGEVESALLELPEVREAVVVAREDRPGIQQLVAYLVYQDETRPDLDAHLRERLPEYMLPSAVVVLPQLPVNANGKIDRKALPQPEWKSDRGQSVPRDGVELKLAQIWEEVLQVRPLGVDENFFELGGNSLLAVRLMSQVERHFAKRLPLAAVFQAATVAEMAGLLREEGEREWSPLVPIQARGSAPPLFLLPGTGGQVLYYHRLAAYLGGDQPVYGLQPPGLDGLTAPLATIEELAAHHLPLLRTVQPHGPYRLCGHSFGGLVAFEMAQQLLEQGEAVALLALLDTPAPGQLERETFQGWDEADWLATIGSLIGELLNRPVDLDGAALRALAPEQRLPRLQQALERVGWLVPGTDPAVLRGLVNVYKANATTAYQPPARRPLALQLFRVEGEDDWGWSKWAGVQVWSTPGSHITMVLEPHVQALAAQLSRLL